MKGRGPPKSKKGSKEGPKKVLNKAEGIKGLPDPWKKWPWENGHRNSQKRKSPPWE